LGGNFITKKNKFNCLSKGIGEYDGGFGKHESLQEKSKNTMYANFGTYIQNFFRRDSTKEVQKIIWYFLKVVKNTGFTSKRNVIIK
jgi:hypothetical protein